MHDDAAWILQHAGLLWHKSCGTHHQEYIVQLSKVYSLLQHLLLKGAALDHTQVVAPKSPAPAVHHTL